MVVQLSQLLEPHVGVLYQYRCGNPAIPAPWLLTCFTVQHQYSCWSVQLPDPHKGVIVLYSIKTILVAQLSLATYVGVQYSTFTVTVAQLSQLPDPWPGYTVLYSVVAKLSQLPNPSLRFCTIPVKLW